MAVGRVFKVRISSQDLRSERRLDLVKEVGMMTARTSGGGHAKDHDPNKHLRQSVDGSGFNI